MSDCMRLICKMQDWCNWPDEQYEEMDSTLATQQVRVDEMLHNVFLHIQDVHVSLALPTVDS